MKFLMENLFFCAVFLTNAQENQIVEQYSIDIFQK